MSKMAYFQGIWLTFIMLMIISMVNGRWLEMEPYLVTSSSLSLLSSSSSSSMISDGIHEMNYENTIPNLDEKRCNSIYGFLPCADTMPEGVFLMVMYTYLMMSGEEWIREGSQALFLLLGGKKIGASVFRVLMALPRLIIVIASGVVTTTSVAQNQVAFGFHMYAGSTVITLTLVWGFRVILSQDKLHGKELEQQEEDPSTTSLSFKDKLSILKDNGVKIDEETREIAQMMLLSLIPFAIVEVVSLIKNPVTILFALILSAISLLLYFGFEIWNPWIDVRSMAYLKQENLRTRFFYHVQRLAEDDLINEDGSPNIKVFESIFEKADKDKDGCISHDELEHLIQKAFELEKDSIPTEYAKAEILTHFDSDKSGHITLSEFQKGCTKWFKKWKNVANNSNSISKTLWKQVENIAIRNKRAKITNIERIMPRILQQVLAEHNLVTENGEPNKKEIEQLFSQHDEDGDHEIHRHELKQFISKLHFGITLDHDTVLDELIKDFDNNTNHTIEKDEFVEGFSKWIKKAIDHDPTIKDPKKAIEKFDKDSWDETESNMVKPITISIMYVISGLVVMSLISAAFIQTVIQFSNAAHIPFVLTSFVMAPLAMNAKMVIKAIINHKAQVMKNASLTFSEIYNGLVMNNLLGLTTLLTIVYIRGLSWTYSSEVLTIMTTCLIVGLFVLKRDTYPLWASICAMLLYPISVYLFYVLDY